MLTLKVPASDLWDPVKEEFITIKEQTVVLEHSLISVSKWESKWHKPFLSKDQKTGEMILDYIRCMIVTPNVSDDVINVIGRNPSLSKQINAYIEDPMTATTVAHLNEKPSREIITSEILYYSMIAYQIPVQFEKWHLNRLLTLIQVCDAKNRKPQKMSNSQRRALNEARRKKYHSKG